VNAINEIELKLPQALFNIGFAKIRADASYLRLFVILLCFISGWTLSI
jgi:hypothetical protein